MCAVGPLAASERGVGRTQRRVPRWQAPHLRRSQNLRATHNDYDLLNDPDELRRRLRASSTYPLFQGMADGSKEWRTLDDDVEDFQRNRSTGPTRRTELLSDEVVEETDDLVIFSLRAESITEDGESFGRYRLLYCVARDGDDWKLAWRQHVGSA